jgi:hypothetical protein
MSIAFLSRWRVRPATLVSLGAVLAGLAVLGLLALHASGQPDAAEPAAAAASPAPVPGAPARVRCESCGVVESITRFEPEGTQPASYEFTVRLRDGSARVSSMPSPFTWRVGDTIMLKGGEAPPLK